MEDSGGLACLDHRDVEAVEDVRMARHRLREEHSALDVRAHLADDGGERLVVGLLLEDDERRDDVEARVDHGRELAREDLERAQLDLLLLRLVGPDGAELGESDRAQAPLAQELPRGVQVRRGDLPGRLGPESIDRAIGERRHTLSLSAGCARRLRRLEVDAGGRHDARQRARRPGPANDDGHLLHAVPAGRRRPRRCTCRRDRNGRRDRSASARACTPRRAGCTPGSPERPSTRCRAW